MNVSLQVMAYETAEARLKGKVINWVKKNQTIL